MNATPNPEVAADKARERYPKGTGQFEALTFDIAFPEAARFCREDRGSGPRGQKLRAFAEKTVAQAREAYDRSTVT